MIQIVFKPEKAPIVRGESMYHAVFNQKNTVSLAKSVKQTERKANYV